MHKVVQLAPNSTAMPYSSAGPYSYRMVSADDRQGRFLADRLLQEVRGKRVALLYVNDDYGRSLRGEVMRAVAPGMVAWVMDAPHVEVDDSAAVGRTVQALAESRPELVLWLGRGTELNKTLPGIRKALGAVAIIGSDGVANAPTFAGTDARWAGVRWVDLVDMDADAGMRAFSARFKARYGLDAGPAAVLAYDAMKVLIAAIEDGARDGTGVQKYLDQLGRKRPAFQGVAGPVIFDRAGDVARGYVLRQIPAVVR
jgi:branched-chain amino acid transport system substrate-binding protein